MWRFKNGNGDSEKRVHLAEIFLHGMKLDGNYKWDRFFSGSSDYQYSRLVQRVNKSRQQLSTSVMNSQQMKEKGLEELVKEKYSLQEAARLEYVEAVKAITQDGKRKARGYL